jgi:hypothetical protein
MCLQQAEQARLETHQPGDTRARAIYMLCHNHHMMQTGVQCDALQAAETADTVFLLMCAFQHQVGGASAGDSRARAFQNHSQDVA